MTRWRTLLWTAVISGALGWLVVVASRSLDLVPPTVPWTTPVVLALVLIFVVVTAVATRRRIHRDRRWIEPSRAVSLLVLGKATALAGAVIGGFSLAYGLMFIGRFEAATPRERVINSLLAALCCLGLVFAGRGLEKACRTPQDEGDDQLSS